MDAAAQLWLFFLLVLGVVLLPGLDMTFVLATTLGGGRRSGFAGVAGITAAGFVHVAVGATGLAVRLRRTIVVQDIASDPRLSYTPEARRRIETSVSRAVLSVPMISTSLRDERSTMSRWIEPTAPDPNRAITSHTSSVVTSRSLNVPTTEKTPVIGPQSHCIQSNAWHSSRSTPPPCSFFAM